jgi:hypothetical protein
MTSSMTTLNTMTLSMTVEICSEECRITATVAILTNIKLGFKKLTRKYYARIKRITMDKHSSLIVQSISEEKKF